jgi:hypothetical protein
MRDGGGLTHPAVFLTTRAMAERHGGLSAWLTSEVAREGVQAGVARLASVFSAAVQLRAGDGELYEAVCAAAVHHAAGGTLAGMPGSRFLAAVLHSGHRSPQARALVQLVTQAQAWDTMPLQHLSRWCHRLTMLADGAMAEAPLQRLVRSVGTGSSSVFQSARGDPHTLSRCAIALLAHVGRPGAAVDADAAAAAALAAAWLHAQRTQRTELRHHPLSVAQGVAATAVRPAGVLGDPPAAARGGVAAHRHGLAAGHSMAPRPLRAGGGWTLALAATAAKRPARRLDAPCRVTRSLACFQHASKRRGVADSHRRGCWRHRTTVSVRTPWLVGSRQRGRPSWPMA